VAIVTNMGTMHFDLYCHLAPKTCENFVELCEKKYFKDTVFHRLIKGFMVQGGDPTATGRGGTSYFGSTFEDEFSDKMLTHSTRGMLSMANSGRDTNGSQFFITFKKLEHLDRKHTVFGKLTKGFNALDKIELMDTNKVDPAKKDRPDKDVTIIDTVILSNPYRKAIVHLLRQDWHVHHRLRNQFLREKKDAMDKNINKQFMKIKE